MSDNSNSPIIGTGWSFPPAFSKVNQRVELVTGRQDIEESFNILLSTAIGERIIEIGYGCDLSSMIFEPLTTTLISRIRNIIEHAVLIYEPRVDLDKVVIDSEDELEGKIIINLAYTIRSTNSKHNFVYPFYLNIDSTS